MSWPGLTYYVMAGLDPAISSSARDRALPLATLVLALRGSLSLYQTKRTPALNDWALLLPLIAPP
jgi:hypothetical protein